MRLRFSTENELLKGKPLLEAAQIQAALNIKGKGEPLAPIRIWWTKKYQKSPNSDEFRRYTLFELMTEFYEDVYTHRPDDMPDLDLPEVVAGDDMVNKWEREISEGVEPDILEDLPPEVANKLKRWSARVHELKQGSGGFVDDHELKDLLEASDDVGGYKETF